jgi:hypothetical protein
MTGVTCFAAKPHSLGTDRKLDAADVRRLDQTARVLLEVLLDVIRHDAN